MRFDQSPLKNWNLKSNNRATQIPLGIFTVISLIYALLCSFLALGAGFEKTQIGEGAFGVVYKVPKTGGTFSAVKEQSWDKDDMKAIQIFKEAGVLFSLNHPRLLHGVRAFMRQGRLCYEMDCYTSDLWKILRSGSVFPPLQIKHLMADLFDGLSFLHLHDLIHCDIKPANLLLDLTTTPRLVVGDFGGVWHARLAESGILKDRELCTRWYRAPELIEFKVDPITKKLRYQAAGESFGTSVDMFSAGCVLAELIVKRPFFPADNEAELAVMHHHWNFPDDRSVVSVYEERSQKASEFEHRLERFKAVAHELRTIAHEFGALELLTGLLHHNPGKRPSALAALASSYIASSVEIPIATEQTRGTNHLSSQFESAHKALLSNRVKTELEWIGRCKYLIGQVHPDKVLEPEFDSEDDEAKDDVDDSSWFLTCTVS